MKIINKKSITLSERQLRDLLARIFKDQFVGSELDITFTLDRHYDYYDREIGGYVLKNVVISGEDWQDLDKLVIKP